MVGQMRHERIHALTRRLQSALQTVALSADLSVVRLQQRVRAAQFFVPQQQTLNAFLELLNQVWVSHSGHIVGGGHPAVTLVF